MNINLHIERLILDGSLFEAKHNETLQAEIETELARLLTEKGIAASWQSGGAVPRARADAVHLTAQSAPAQIGQQIARSIYGSIGETL